MMIGDRNGTGDLERKDGGGGGIEDFLTVRQWPGKPDSSIPQYTVVRRLR